MRSKETSTQFYDQRWAMITPWDIGGYRVATSYQVGKGCRPSQSWPSKPRRMTEPSRFRSWTRGLSCTSCEPRSTPGSSPRPSRRCTSLEASSFQGKHNKAWVSAEKRMKACSSLELSSPWKWPPFSAQASAKTHQSSSIRTKSDNLWVSSNIIFF